MINATKVFSSACALTSLDLKSLFCSKASFVRIAAAVSIAIIRLVYGSDLTHEVPTLSLDYTPIWTCHSDIPKQCLVKLFSSFGSLFLIPFSGLLGANERHKFLVPVRYKIQLHFIDRVANGRTGRDKYPSALGTAPTLNRLHPNQFSGHA